MTNKEFLIQSCLEMEAINFQLKRERNKMKLEIKKLRKKIAGDRKNRALICDVTVNVHDNMNKDV